MIKGEDDGRCRGMKTVYRCGGEERKMGRKGGNHTEEMMKGEKEGKDVGRCRGVKTMYGCSEEGRMMGRKGENKHRT